MNRLPPRPVAPSQPQVSFTFDGPGANRVGRFRVPRHTRRQAAVAIAALIAPFLGASPVGVDILDWTWCAALAAAAAFLGTSSKRVPLVLAALLAVASARTGLALGFASVAVVSAGMSTRHLRRKGIFSRGVSGGATALSFLATGGQVSALHLLLVVAVAGVLIGSGFRHASSRLQRRMAWGAGALVGCAILAGAIALVGVAESSGHLRAGSSELRLGLAAARSGDVSGAAQHLELARTNVTQARRTLSRFGAGARLFPVAAQQIASVVDVLADVDRAATAARRAAGLAGDDGLAVKAGTIDLELLEDLRTPLSRLAKALDDIVSQVDAHAADPLLPPLRDRLEELRAEASRARGEARLGADAAAVLPDVLGGEALQRYLVVFTSPAEARGRFGFPGSFAEVTFENGRFRLGEHGSSSTAFNGLDVDQTRFDLGDTNVRPYVSYGVTREVLASTIPPDFPTVARLLTEMWEESGRAPLDGVLRFDPASLASLMSFTGPVAVEGRDDPLTAENVERFLLVGQYVQYPDDQAPRRELLDTVATTTFERLETADLPAPRQLVDLFAPLVRQGHLQIATRDATAQGLLDRVGIDGRLAPPAVDGLLVTTVNGLGNKIDSLLQKSIRYEGAVRDGRVEATLSVELVNAAPSSGLPRYVIGSFARPAPAPGTNRTTVFVYTGVPASEILLDGRPVESVSSQTNGWWIHQLVVEIPPGGSKTIDVRLDGELPDDRYHLEVEPSGGTRPDVVEVDLQVDGRRLVWTGRPEAPLTLP